MLPKAIGNTVLTIYLSQAQELGVSHQRYYVLLTRITSLKLVSPSMTLRKACS